MKERVGTYEGVDVFTDDTKYVMVNIGELNEVVADARRYRWLRENFSVLPNEPFIAYRSYLGINQFVGSDADAAIDAAMADEARYTITPKGREMLREAE